jgi:uncharacterized SAM-binding protein YcdF (DUF218 family)
MTALYFFLSQLLQPFTLLMLLLGVCVFWPQKSGAPRRRGLKLCYLAVYVYCTPLAAYTSIWLLERNYPPTEARPENLEAIVVLGGGVRLRQTSMDSFRLDESSLGRCERAAQLYLDGAPCSMLVSGGPISSEIPNPTVSQVMAEALSQMGVASTDIVQESVSRTTAENARLSATIIANRGWKRIALVTSATHLQRSQRLFRNEGVDTIPIGCNYHIPEFRWNVFTFLPRYGAVVWQEEAWHEFLGCAYLLVRGKW